MKTGIAAAVAGLVVSSMASAAFTGYQVTSTNVTNSGQNLTVYTLWATFNGPTDTVLNAFNLAAVGGSNLGGFWHKDLADSSAPGVLSQTSGTWNPTQTGSATNNRPFDSYLTIGNQAVNTNSTNADPSWPAAGGSWNRPDVPNGLNVGWFNSNPPNLQGRVGATGNTATDVRLGQFVIDRDADGGTWNLKIGYTDGVTTQVQFAETSFSLPAPGAMALLGLAGLAGRRRR